MKNQRSDMKKIKLISMVLDISFLTNCTTQLPTVRNTDTTKPTDTLRSDIQRSATATGTPPPTNLPTLTPTRIWTPLPTLSEQQAHAEINELLETNGGCELPCWWGLVPNQTSWPEALHFLTPIIVEIREGERINFQKDDKMHYTTSFGVYYEIAGLSELGRILIGVQDDIISGITVFPPAAEYKYQLHQLLAVLGPPNQILISAQSYSTIPELPPTVLVLDYSDIGVWASYGYIPRQAGENLVICPRSSLGKVSAYDNVGGRLRLFDPNMESDRAFSIQEYADIVGGLTAQKLEDVTNMTIETFYNTFIDPSPETCLETPANLWP